MGPPIATEDHLLCFPTIPVLAQPIELYGHASAGSNRTRELEPAGVSKFCRLLLPVEGSG